MQKYMKNVKIPRVISKLYCHPNTIRIIIQQYEIVEASPNKNDKLS
jgi:hypothetical protein